MKYVYLGLFIIGCLGLAYVIYSLELNRKLNIKKRQIAIRPKKNRYIIMAAINLTFILVFGGLSLHELNSRHEIPVAPIVNPEEDTKDKKVEKEVKYLSLKDTDIAYSEKQKVFSDKDATFFIEDEKLYRADFKTNKIDKIDTLKLDGFLITKKYIVVYFNNVLDNNDIFTLEIYDKDELQLVKKIVGDGKILYANLSEGLFSGNTFDIVLETMNVSMPENIGYVETNYTYETILNELDEEEIKCTEVEEEKVFLEKINYSKNYEYDRFLMHLQCDLTSSIFKEVAFALTDYFIVYTNDYYYIYCNCFKDGDYENKSYVLKYNCDEMNVADYHLFENVIYSSPIIYKYDLISTYMTFITYNMSYDNYQKVTIDTLLNVIDIKDIYVDNKIEDKKKTCIFNNKVCNFDNVLFFNNNKLINYAVSEDGIIINEYIFNDKVINSYKLMIEEDFEEANIIELIKVDNDYFVTYTVDGKNGYAYFEILEYDAKKDKTKTEDPNSQEKDNQNDNENKPEDKEPNVRIEEKKEPILQELVINLEIFDSNKYYISLDYLIAINEEKEIEIISIKDLLKNNEEKNPEDNKESE